MMNQKLNKRTRSALLIKEQAALFRCPICASEMNIIDLKSLVCKNNHSFDVAKQGYLNLLTQQNKTNYNKELFESRRHVIAESGFFDELSDNIIALIHQHETSTDTLNLVDMGSGEGTLLANLTQTLEDNHDKIVTGIGIDISKEGILEAAKHYAENIWVVADLARVPLTDQMCDVIINILSPSNYSEFNRILKNDALLIKVIPRKNYLKELRNYFYQDSDQEAYSNLKVVNHLKDNYSIISETKVCYKQALNKTALTALIKMTPLTWHVSDKEIEDFLATDVSEVTVDLEVIVGKKSILQK